MMSYPEEKDKGRAFSLFWSIFSLGALVGSAIALGIESKSTLPTVSTGVYLAFMIIMLTSVFTSWLILPPHLVIRNDGTIVEVQAHITPAQEFKAFANLLKDWRIIALFPMFFSSNYFYSYQGAIVAILFNGRTRALSSLLTGLGAIVGSIWIGFVLDGLPLSRRMRSMYGVGFVTALVIATWSGGMQAMQRSRRSLTLEGLHFQLGFTREKPPNGAPWDWKDSSSGGPLALLMFCKFF